MNDFIDVKLAFSNYVHNIAAVIYRYINNGALKKVLIFPLFILILILEISLFPLALVGAIAKWLITLVVWLTDDRTPALLYAMVILFVEVFALYYLAFIILIAFYKLFDLMSNGLGKANYSENADDFVRMNEGCLNEEKEEEKQNKNDEIYVIETSDYK